MKRSFGGVTLGIVAVILGAILVGCPSPFRGGGGDDSGGNPDQGAIVLRFSDVRTLTIDPDRSLDIDSYTVSFTQDGVPPVTVSGIPGSATQTEPVYLDPGTWTVTVTAQNDTGDIIGVGSAPDVVISAGQTSSVNLSIVSLTGDGTLNLTADISQLSMTGPTVTGSLLPGSGGPAIPISLDIAGSSGSFSGPIPAGSYFLQLELRDGAELLASYVDSVLIATGLPSSGSLVFRPKVGSVDVELIDDIARPISISFDGALPTIGTDESMTVTATPSQTVDSYQWYFDGQAISMATSDTVTVGPGLDPGEYTLTVIVRKGAIYSSEAADFTVVDQIIYTVSFNSHGGSAVADQAVASGATVTEPADPVRAGLSFGGWFTDDGPFADAWDFATDTVSGDITLHANWMPEIAKLLAADGAGGDQFGYSVDLDGDYAIVGAPQDDDSGSQSGSAYIFRRSGITSWDAGTKIVASDGVAADFFGWSVSISGDYAIVGAPFDADNGANSGSAYIFQRTGTNSWDTGTKVVAFDGAANDEFGWSVSISGDYAIVGADGDDDGGANTGSAYIFHRTGTNSWDSGVKISALDRRFGDLFGSSVSIDGDYAIIGARFGDIGDGSRGGSAYIFHRTGTTDWDAGTEIVASDGVANDNFGFSVSIDGEYAIVAAVGDDDNGSDSGSAYIFRRTGTNSWEEDAKLLASDGAAIDQFGYSVSIDGDYAIVGAQRDDDNGTDSGSAYLFHRTAAGWDTGTKIVAPGGDDGDSFGISVSADSDNAIVGAFQDAGNGFGSGSAYVWRIAP